MEILFPPRNRSTENSFDGWADAWQAGRRQHERHSTRTYRCTHICVVTTGDWFRVDDARGRSPPDWFHCRCCCCTQSINTPPYRWRWSWSGGIKSLERVFDTIAASVTTCWTNLWLYLPIYLVRTESFNNHNSRRVDPNQGRTM